MRVIQSPKSMLRTIIIISISLVVVSIGIVSFIGYNALGARANNTEPKAVTITNITQSSAMVTFTTDGDAQFIVAYGKDPQKLNLFALESTKSVTHSIPLTLLEPSTSYFLEIKDGSTVHSNSGIPWQFRTLSGSSTLTIPKEETTPANDETTCNFKSCKLIKENLGLKGNCTTKDLIANNCYSFSE
jgi:hypothetical protein